MHGSVDVRIALSRRLYTAHEFLSHFEPRVLHLMLNPEEALQEDTETARAIARGLGEFFVDDRFSPIVWELVYP
jgi:hypothetical protein